MTLVAIHDRGVDDMPGLEFKESAAGVEIFREGRSGKTAYIVQSGLVEISKIHSTGESMTGYIGAGEIFDEMPPIDAEPRMANARAL